MIKNVKKRDGRIVPYDRSKITTAILKAMKAVDDVDETQAEILSVFVEDRLSEKGREEFGIEEIQDVVIKVLMDSPFKDVAQEYTEYRYKRMMAKKASTNEIFKSIINAQANDITRENANMNADTPAGMMMKFASEAAKTFVDENLLSADVKKAVEDNILHIHDKDYFPTKSLTCTTGDTNITIRKADGSVEHVKMSYFDKYFTGSATKEGQNVKPEDFVWIQGRNGWTKILGISRRICQDDEHLWEFKIKKSLPLKVTGNHLIPIVNNDNKEVLLHADEIEKGSSLIKKGSLDVDNIGYDHIDVLKTMLKSDLDRSDIVICNIKKLIWFLKYKYDIRSLSKYIGSDTYRRGVEYLTLEDYANITSAFELPEEVKETLGVKVFKGKDFLPIYLPVTPELAEVFGYMHSEGSISINNERGAYQFAFVNYSGDINSRFLESWNKVFSVPLSERIMKVNGEKKHTGWTLSSKLLCYFFGSGISTFRSSSEISVPEFILNGTDEIKWHYLSALYDGDGCLSVRGRNITYITTSEDLAEGIIMILESLGITPNFQKRNTAGSVANFGEKQSIRKHDEIRINISSYEMIEKFLNGLKGIKRHEINEFYAAKPACGMRNIPGEIEDKFPLNPKGVVVYDLETAEHWFVANGVVVHNCIQHPQDEIFGDGFIDGHAIVRPVRRIESASMISAIEMEAVQNEMHGGQAIPAFDFYLAPFVRKAFEKEAARDGKRYGIPCERVLALKIKDYLDPDKEKWENILAEPETIGDFSEAEMNLLAGAMSKTVKRVHQSMESFVHNMNTIHSRGGNQVVFSSINYGTDTSPEGRCIIREVLNTTYEGVGNGETAIFPIQIWKMKAGVSRYEGDPNYDLLQFAVRVTARRFFPNYLNLDASFNQDDAWKGDDPRRFEHEVATMGCVAGESLVQYRLMNTAYLETFEQMWKRMSYWFNPVSQKKLGYEGGQYIPLEGVSIYDNGKWTSCVGIIKNPDKGDWMKVTFSDGRTITATSDHPWAVVEKDGKRLKETVTKTVALKKGDLMLAENPQKGKRREQYFLSVESVAALPAYHASSYDVTTSSEHFTVSGVRSHNCRTRVYENRFGPKTSIGRGNLSFSTLNLPGLAIRCMSIANRDMRIKQFFSYLSRYLDLTAKQLDERFQFQGTAIAKQFPVLMGGAGKGQGIWIGSKELGPNDSVLPVLNQGTLGIGFIGLAECLVALTGHHHGEDPEAQRLGLQIVEFMNEKVKGYCEQYKHNYSVLGTPAEGLSGRFTKIDRKKFGIIPGVTDKDYYTNSSHVPVWYKCSASHKAEVEGPYHKLERGGHIFYVEMDGDATHNPEAIMAVLNLMNKYDIGYGSVNHNRNRCLDCGYEDATEGLEVCPKCGGHHIDRLQRITGYLVGTTDRWNSGKKAELYDRVTHTNTDK